MTARKPLYLDSTGSLAEVPAGDTVSGTSDKLNNSGTDTFTGPQLTVTNGSTLEFRVIGSSSLPNNDTESTVARTSQVNGAWKSWKENGTVRWRQGLTPGDTLSDLYLYYYDASNAQVPYAKFTRGGRLYIYQGVEYNPPSGDSFAVFRKAASGASAYFVGATGSTKRWRLTLGNATSETGSNAGSNFEIVAFNDADTVATTVMTIARGSGLTSLMALYASGKIQSAIGYASVAGSGGAGGGNVFNIYWSGSAAQLWIDSSNIGNITVTSDTRFKKFVKGLARFGQYADIVPISYNFKKVGIFRDDGKNRWGFSAQNLAEIGLDAAVNGDVDAVDEKGDPIPASLDTTPILALTVLEVQALLLSVAELTERVATLEAQLSPAQGT